MEISALKLMTGLDATPTAKTVISLIQLVTLWRGNLLETNAGACPGSVLLSATLTVIHAAPVRALVTVLVIAGRVGLGIRQAKQTLTRTCADANRATRNNKKKDKEDMAANAVRSTLAIVELTAIIAVLTGTLSQMEQIAMASAGARPGRFARSSGVKKDALPKALDSAVHTAAIAASLGRLATLTAQPSTADARTGGATIE